METAALEKLIADGRDSALLRLSLGQIYSQQGKLDLAVRHLEMAVELDPGYSAAWKSLAAALVQSGHNGLAIEAYERGIAIASEQGDKQAEKEMQVFLRRLQRSQ